MLQDINFKALQHTGRLQIAMHRVAQIESELMVRFMDLEELEALIKGGMDKRGELQTNLDNLKVDIEAFIIRWRTATAIADAISEEEGKSS